MESINLDNISLILLILNMVVSFLVVGGSFHYFILVKSKFRWIKLFWGLEMSVFTLIMLWTIIGGIPSINTQLVVLLLPTTCLLYGLVSAFSRKKEMDYLTQLEEALNGNMQTWIEEQTALAKSKKVEAERHE